MKALILSCNTGQGHNAAGLAVLEHMRARGIPCEMRDTLSFGGQNTSEVVSGAYMKIAAELPWLFHGMYAAGDFISSPRVKSPVYFANTAYAAEMARYIDENDVDTVVCPHLFPAEALTYLKRKKVLRARTYAVATDYTCIPFWEETDLDRYFVPHPLLSDEFANKGIPREKIAPTGIPVSARFAAKVDKAEARARLGMPADGRVILVMTGSMGFGHTVRLAEQLLPCGAYVYVMVGKSEELKNELAGAFGESGRVVAVPFTTDVPLYMDACDVLLTKPGGLSSTEAAVKNVPLVHTEPIPGCETRNAAFFTRNGLSALGDDPADAARQAMALLLNDAAREAMLRNQRNVINARAADDIVDQMLADERE